MTGWPENLTPDTSRLNAILPHPPADTRIPEGWLSQWQEVWAPLAATLAGIISDSPLPPVIGIHGGQGSGKSTLSLALKDIYKAVFGWNIVVVSIDDLYLSHADRQSLSKDIHPLLATRGVPGTHEVDRGIALFKTLRQLKQGDTCSIPAFDKASDDRLPESQWHQVSGPIDAILFEGWCVGCQSVQDELLYSPVNELEEQEDEDGVWRGWVNQQLAGPYKEWFSAIDFLIMLKVPDMAAVQRWRTQQEVGNKKMAKGSTDRSLDETAIQRFIQHYERLTRQALTRLPELANLILSINDEHKVADIQTREFRT
jgi:D-glycerate 3-kinase